MDPHAFDRATRLFRAPRSRRAAWRALLGAALLGTTTRRAAAAPCGNGKNPACTCGGVDCDPGKCFRHVNDDRDELCCTGTDRIICGNRCCKVDPEKVEDPCECCYDPDDETVIAAADDPCPEGITGSYRRR